MRIVIFSDTHNSFAAADKIFKQNKDVSDNFLSWGTAPRKWNTCGPSTPRRTYTAFPATATTAQRRSI